LSIDDCVTPEYIYDINLLCEANTNAGHPDNFMGLDTSSDKGTVDENNKGKTNPIDSSADNKEGVNEKVERDIDTSRRLNPSTGGSQSSKIPQTEFESKPYLEYAPLPKSQSDPVSLGKNNK
jgi:hypothetical protein